MIHLFCWISIAVVLAKDLLIDKSFDGVKFFPVAVYIWVVFVFLARLCYWFGFHGFLIGTFGYMIFVYLFTLFIFLHPLIFNLSPEGALFFLSLSSAMTEIASYDLE